MTIALSKSSKNVLILENAYKVLYRWYYMQVRLAWFIPSYSPLFLWGCSLEGTMAHIWWSCPKVCRLWVRIYALLRNIFRTNIKLLRPEHQLALHLLLLRDYWETIERAWKTPVLSFEAIKNRMNDIMVNEKLTALASDTQCISQSLATLDRLYSQLQIQ